MTVYNGQRGALDEALLAGCTMYLLSMVFKSAIYVDFFIQNIFIFLNDNIIILINLGDLKDCMACTCVICSFVQFLYHSKVVVGYIQSVSSSGDAIKTTKSPRKLQ